MMHLKNGWFLLVLAVLASCSSDELGPPRDVAYYMEHDEERKAVIAKCDNDPGRLELHPNCENAYTARTELMLTSGNTGSRPPPPGYFSWTQEERDKFNNLTREEKDQYYEEQN